MDTLKMLKSDFHHVFIDGEVKGKEFLHVFLVLDIPLLIALVIYWLV
ncbi:hypothetical protein ACPPVU_09150 [Mucilaginibacter sp. McL0603]